MSRPLRVLFPTICLTGLCGLSAECFGDAVIGDVHGKSLETYLPSSATGVQDIRPNNSQRGRRLDGTASPPQQQSQEDIGLGMLPPGTGGGVLDTPCDVQHDCSNPPPEGCGGDGGGAPLMLGDRSFLVVDLQLPSSGIDWSVGRSYNHQQELSGSHHDSDGYQGRNWFQNTQPEIVLYEHPTDDAEDVIYIIGIASNFIEFKRKDSTSNSFKGVNGTQGVIQFTAGSGSEPDTYTHTIARGTQWTYFGFDADASPSEGQLWKIEDPAGNTTYVGDDTTASTAITNGYDASGRITTAYDSAGRKYVYTYASGRLTKVEVQVDEGGGYSATGYKVEYDHYGNETHGNPGDLKLVTVTVPQSDSGVEIEYTTYYRYWEGTFDAQNNPGHPHLIKYIYHSEGLRQYDWSDEEFDEDFLTGSESSLKPYATSYYEYDANYRVTESWSNGACGCGGGALNGAHEYTYETNSSFTNTTDTYDTTWKARTIVKQPDGSFVTHYFDETGQPLSRVITDSDPSGSPDVWATYVERNSDGRVISRHTPANVTGYTHSSGAFTTSTTAGLVTHYEYHTGNLAGQLKHTKVSEGANGDEYLVRTILFEEVDLTVGDVILDIPFTEASTSYSEKTTTADDGTTLPGGATRTEYSYTFHSSTATDMLAVRPKAITTSYPAVDSTKNGSDTSNTATRYLREDGTTAFAKAPDGIFTYTEYEHDQLIERIEDAKTTSGGFDLDPNGYFGITETGDGVHRKTTFAYDDQGRRETVTAPDGDITRQYVSKLDDGRQVKLSYPKYEASPETFYGPVGYAVLNHTGKGEVQGIVDLGSDTTTSATTTHIDETDDDPLTALDLGTVARMTVNIYDDSGNRLEESRQYVSLPASGAGTEGTNYNATSYEYDDSGRRIRVEDPTGTISATVYDAIGRPSEQWIGTDDSGGVDDNMVKTSLTEYDSGNDGENSRVTKRSTDPDGDWSSPNNDVRETTYEYDWRGRTIIVTPSEGPQTLSEYDARGRTKASGQYEATASLTTADNPKSLATDRLVLTENFYDEMGRVWKSVRYKIDPADGSNDDSLESLTWYDEVGRVVKTDSEQLSKTTYDRLGRQTHQFILASDNDTGYSDADDVTGDIVLEEYQTVYESTGSDRVLASATIQRYHDDFGSGETTGALDTNADSDDLKFTASNLEGRIQISATWYDDLGRQETSAIYGTNGGSDFDREGMGVPSGSSTILVTDYVYNTDGTLKETIDPMAQKTRYEYDDAGRRITVIANYVNGSPSSATADDDAITRYVYSDGLQTKLWVDLYPADTDGTPDSEDQVTSYAYGMSTSDTPGPSKLDSGRLLRSVTYPDSGVVKYAYNALGQQIYMQDQADNVIETVYDDAGRTEHRKATTIKTLAGFDDAVKRITYAYDDQGRQETITQYDDATPGSGNVVNEVKFNYDGWGNIDTYEQDANSTVATGGDHLYEVSYAYAKATTGRNTLRRTSMTLPDGSSVNFNYRGGILHDDETSRVSYLALGATTIATYDYLGSGRVVGTELNEPDVMWEMFGSTSGSYPDLDRFNRVTSSRWTKDLSTDIDFVDFDIYYDDNSNITRTEDNIYPAGFDVAYDLDGMNRLTDATEGTWNGSIITSKTREELYTLDQVGNFEFFKRDLDGNGLFTGTDEWDDDRTHNKVNELTARDIDDDGTDDYTLVYDAVGNMTDNGQNYEFVYDVWGRLQKITTRGTSPRLVAEYEYFGNNYRASAHYDTDVDNDVDSNDKTYYFAYNERWQMMAVYRDTDSDPKEQFVYHLAGNSGYGGSSYIDQVILRDRDDTNGWTGAADGTLEERVYYCQNWRFDIVALVTDTGELAERARYSPYGVPFGMPLGDVNGDGSVSGTDTGIILGHYGSSNWRSDLNLDGVIDSADHTIANNNFGAAGGREVLSDIGNRKGYAAYEYAFIGESLYHVRNRVYDAELARWTRRDPLGYVDGHNIYAYLSSNSIVTVDPWGLGPGGGPWWVTGCAAEADNWEDCNFCCYYNSNGQWDDSAEQCKDNCDKAFPSDNPPSPSPHDRVSIFTCKNTETQSEPDTTTCLEAYDPCHCYQNANVRCMCQCMGNDAPWKNFLRACLQCMLDVEGISWHEAHNTCLRAAHARWFFITPLVFASCYLECWSWHVCVCGGNPCISPTPGK